MDYQIFIFSRNELKIIIVGTIIGGISQIICWKYLKNHPELLNNHNSEKLEPKKPGLRRFFSRGDAVLQITGFKLVINVASTIVFVAKKGAWISMFLTGSGVLVKKIPKNAINTIVHKALPITYSDLEKTYILVDGKKIVLNQCDRTFEYMFRLLNDKDILFEDRKKKSFEILMKYLDLKTTAGRIRFVLCIVSIIHIFALNDTSSIFILIKNLIKAVKSGKISKRLARLIIRRLLRLNVTVDPELMKVVDYA